MSTVFHELNRNPVDQSIKYKENSFPVVRPPTFDSLNLTSMNGVVIKLLTLCFLSLSMTYDYISPRERTESTQVYDLLSFTLERAIDRYNKLIDRVFLLILLMFYSLMNTIYDDERNTFQRFREFLVPALAFKRSSIRKARFSFSCFQ
ncbi:hypothetical protein K0M31_008027 [Melipona bicolor]|uniref:Uncharacterized protein n=1 Tax=Melipona bicolor TaxID=60889 RepID=A0AA40KWA1_9HYME|nr:hypothetical protein K0M31_008027 [Melipona bicolor]